MPDLINWELMRSPLNWIIVALMVAFAVLALTYLQPYFGITADSEG